MKTKHFLLTTMVGLSLAVMISCNKKEETEPEPTTPAYNFTAKVDGKVFQSATAKGEVYSGTLAISANPAAPNHFIGLGFQVVLDSLDVKTYPFSKPANGPNAYGQYLDQTSDEDYWQTDASSLAAGEKLVITAYDKTAKKISGTFSFTAKGKDDPSNIVVVTEGKFTDLTW